MTGLALGRLGIGAVVVEGKPPAGDLFLLVISPVGAELVPADSLRGKVTSEATALLRKKYGSQAAVLCIGPAGERQALAAAAINTDLTGAVLPGKRPGRDGGTAGQQGAQRGGNPAGRPACQAGKGQGGPGGGPADLSAGCYRQCPVQKLPGSGHHADHGFGQQPGLPADRQFPPRLF